MLRKTRRVRLVWHGERKRRGVAPAGFQIRRNLFGGELAGLVDVALDDIFGGRLSTLASNSYNVAQATKEADLVIGGVLIPGATAPKIVTKAMVAQMKKGAVIVDVAIDQGGCVETARPTSHSNPSYQVDGVVHYCVTNMPGAVPHTSTLALTNSTFPYLLRIANLGALEALRQDPGLAEGLNTWLGKLTHRGVAESQLRPFTATASLIA